MVNEEHDLSRHASSRWLSLRTAGRVFPGKTRLPGNAGVGFLVVGITYGLHIIICILCVVCDSHNGVTRADPSFGKGGKGGVYSVLRTYVVHTST